MHAENGEAALSIPRATAGIADVLARGVALVADDDGGLVGSFGMRPMELAWYAEEMALFETWFFVRAEARRSTIALRLKAAAERIARGGGWKLVNSLTTRTDLDRKAKMYRGQAEIGRIFMYEGV